MATRSPSPVLNGMPRRSARYHQALNAGYAQVDGRSPEELIEFASKITAYFHYYNIENHRDGNWQAFFSSDARAVRTLLSGSNQLSLAEKLATVQADMARAVTLSAKVQSLEKAVIPILNAMKSVDSWLWGLWAGPHRKSPRTVLAGTIERFIQAELGPALRTLKSLWLGAAPKSANRAIFEQVSLSSFWGLSGVVPDHSLLNQSGMIARAELLGRSVNAVLDVFPRGLQDLTSAIAALPDIPVDGTDAPQMALYSAFVRLFRHAQNTINTFSRRYVDFYYRGVLKESPAGPVPDKAYLTFSLAADTDVNSTLVPAGTEFSAGEDAEGHTIVFASNTSIQATTATLAAVRTLRLMSGELYSGSRTTAVRRILASEVNLNASTQSDQTPTPAWSTFGPNEPGASAVEVTASAKIGFTAACKTLHLTAGEREIRFDFACESAGLISSVADIANATGLSASDVLTSALSQAFELNLSTADGWFAVPDYTAFTNPVPPPSVAFLLRVLLPETAPAVAPLGPEEPADDSGESTTINPSPNLPTLMVHLKTDPMRISGPLGEVTVYPVSLFYGVLLQQLGVSVDVTDFPLTDLSNTDGPIDTTAVFFMFGGTPSQGSTLSIHSTELFEKKLTSLQLQLNWSALPPNDNGFFGYYYDYTIDLNGVTHDPEKDPIYTNQSFCVSWQVENPGTWTFDNSNSQYLFRTLDTAPLSPPNGTPFDDLTTNPAPKGRLAPDSSFDWTTLVPNKLPPYYDPSTGAIQVTLTEPSYAFGDLLYPVNVLNSVLEVMKDFCPKQTSTQSNTDTLTTSVDATGSPRTSANSSTDDTPLLYPNAPWVPQLLSISAHYSADEVIFGADASTDTALFQLLPWSGSRKVSSRDSSVSLFPVFAHSGNLYLGFTGLVTPVRQTFLFQMEPLWSISDSPMPSVHWEILSEAGWLALPPKRVDSDSTSGLTKTGIVTLSLPTASGQNRSLLPGDLQWLRACVNEGESRFPKTVALYPNAALSHFKPGDATGVHLSAPLPPHTITQALTDLPDVETIDQPMASFGGVPAEDDETFYTRLGERLRHKDRALQAWDIERLVFQNYPAIEQAVALPCRTAAGTKKAGHTLVVVIPGPASNETSDPTTPAAPSDLLGEIQQTIQDKSSAFVQVAVANPIYVRIAVTAQVEFRDPDDVGNSIRRLNDDLITYLSPWSDGPEKAQYGAHYASEEAILNFVSTRPYVAAVFSISYGYSPPRESVPWYYLTSAAQHTISEPGETLQTLAGAS
ncbi:MAG: baseplate J/gp47 family protein [Polyangiaceae bacterium]|nr:baseplate J/gp47 family protein [Polyangiaceae bacterium]